MSQPEIIGGRYRIDRLIGQGGMGRVYYGFDMETGEPVAIKALKSSVVMRNSRLLERFRREGQALKELNHPNIVKMLAALEEDGQHYLVMEYVRGGSLYGLLKKEGCLPVEQVLAIALDLSDALTRAHRLKIIHRDIKPANVLLAEDGTPRLTDFGAAHMGKMGSITKQGSIIGTVSYLAPEVCQGKLLDARADIWAFGVMLLEMVTGQRPFDRKERIATALAIVREPLPDLVALMPDVPPPFVSLLYRMLEKDPDQRIGSMRQVGAELEAIIQKTGTGVREELDLIYRMLEDDKDKPVSGARLSGSKLSHSRTRPAAPRATEPLPPDSAQASASPSESPDAPAPQPAVAPALASDPAGGQTWLLAGAVVVVLALAIVLVLLLLA